MNMFEKLFNIQAGDFAVVELPSGGTTQRKIISISDTQVLTEGAAFWAGSGREARNTPACEQIINFQKRKFGE